MYHVLSDGTLIGLTKRQLIEQVRIAEHNWFSCEERLKQQYENIKDFEPVVRCKDCKLYKPIDDCKGKCPFLIGDSQFRSPDGYCDLGERKDGDE